MNSSLIHCCQSTKPGKKNRAKFGNYGVKSNLRQSLPPFFRHFFSPLCHEERKVPKLRLPQVVNIYNGSSYSWYVLLIKLFYHYLHFITCLVCTNTCLKFAIFRYHEIHVLESWVFNMPSLRRWLQLENPCFSLFSRFLCHFLHDSEFKSVQSMGIWSFFLSDPQRPYASFLTSPSYPPFSTT